MPVAPLRWTVAIAVAVAILACDIYPAWLEPAEAGPDFPVQGEYAAASAGAQVVALGGGSFRLVHLAGGLPGAGWDGVGRRVVEGRRDPDGSEVRFDDGSAIADGVLRVGDARLSRVQRVSPSAGAPPPPGAVVLFDGALGPLDGQVDLRGLLAAGATSRDAFGDARIHLEFRTPFMPSARGQARGDSGVYVQNRYEVQVLDSFGDGGAANACGALYELRPPDLHMAWPPLRWQSFDIEFRAARFDASGARSENARISVRHNGVPIHEDVELPGPTGGGDAEGPEPGPLHLQNNGDPVYYRNVWVLPLAADAPGLGP